MPRTLHEIDPLTAIHIDDQGDALAARPELAVLVARIVSSWSTVEGFIGLAAAALLAGRAEVAMSMFESLTGASRTSALYAAARSALPPQDAKLFCATLKVINSLGSGRHLLAHGMIAEGGGIRDALLVVEPKHFSSVTKILFQPPNPGEERSDQVKRELVELSKNVLVLGKAELEETLVATGRANSLATNLAVLAAPYHHERETARSELQADPDVAARLRKS